MTGPTNRTTLLVGCGRIGRRLGSRLIGTGEQVVALRRFPEELPDSFTRITSDLLLDQGLELPAVDTMVITLPPPEDEHGYRTPLRTLAAALPAVPERTLFVSSTRVFEGCGAEHPVTEATAPWPLSERARVLLRGERLAEDLFGALIVRPAGIYGPGRERLLRSVLAGDAVPHGRRTNRIHETDLVRALEKLLLDPSPPPLLHAVDEEPARLGRVVAHIAARLGVPVPPSTQTPPRGGTVLDGARLRSFLGPLDFPDFRSGYDAVIDDFDPGAR